MSKFSHATMMINFRPLYRVGMDLKLHVNLIISFSTETINKATSWHSFDLVFKIALDNSKRSSHHFNKGLDNFHPNSSHLHILHLPQSSTPPGQPDWIEGGTYVCASDTSLGPYIWASLLEKINKDITCN